jgi:hypothetical protein
LDGALETGGVVGVDASAGEDVTDDAGRTNLLAEPPHEEMASTTKANPHAAYGAKNLRRTSNLLFLRGRHQC